MKAKNKKKVMGQNGSSAPEVRQVFTWPMTSISDMLTEPLSGVRAPLVTLVKSSPINRGAF